MPGTYPGAFGTKKSPATLDVSQIIRKVEWATGPNVLMIWVSVNVQQHEPHAIPVKAFAVQDIANIFDDPIHIHDTHTPVPTVANPMNADMISHTFAWNRAPRKPDGGPDKIFQWRAALFFNLGKIKSLAVVSGEHITKYEITIRFPASEKTTESSVAYYAYADPFGNSFDYYQAHPTTTGAIIDAFGHTGIVTSPIVFGSAAQRSEFLGFNAGSLPPWVAFDKPGTGDVWDLLDWDLKAYTFLKRKDFKLKDDLSPDPSILDATNQSATEQRDHSTVDHSIPSETVTLTINLKTLAMTSKKV
jgi:hypothetical protein